MGSLFDQEEDNEFIRWMLDPFAVPTLSPPVVERCSRDGRYGIAVFSDPESEGAPSRFRHLLAWFWDWSRPVLFVIMLNPSTAGAFDDDQTMRKVIGFARRFGYGAVVVVNQSDFRATNPADAKAAGWPRTGYNDRLIRMVLNDLRPGEMVRDILCAWGNHGPKMSSWATGRPRHPNVRLRHIGITKAGRPEHPCMPSYDRQLQEWSA